MVLFRGIVPSLPGFSLDQDDIFLDCTSLPSFFLELGDNFTYNNPFRRKLLLTKNGIPPDVN